MRTVLSILFTAIVFCASAFSQQDSYSPSSPDAAKTSLLSSEIRNAVDDAKIINIDIEELKSQITVAEAVYSDAAVNYYECSEEYNYKP